jgi:hypothetical protein
VRSDSVPTVIARRIVAISMTGHIEQRSVEFPD